MMARDRAAFVVANMDIFARALIRRKAYEGRS
jgi:hypothetical protein